mgnify:CR=1 FL=1
MKRIFLFVLDSFGIGAMPDSESFGDVGVNTLASCATSSKLNIPNMIAAGLGNMVGVRPNGPNDHAYCDSVDKQRDQYVRTGIKVTPKRLQTHTGTGMAREGNNKKQHPTAPKCPALLETQAQNATDCKGERIINAYKQVRHQCKDQTGEECNAKESYTCNDTGCPV